jgi:hypothetical protein
VLPFHGHWLGPRRGGTRQPIDASRCRWSDSNRRPMELESTASLPTGLQPAWLCDPPTDAVVTGHVRFRIRQPPCRSRDGTRNDHRGPAGGTLNETRRGSGDVFAPPRAGVSRKTHPVNSPGDGGRCGATHPDASVAPPPAAKDMLPVNGRSRGRGPARPPRRPEEDIHPHMPVSTDCRRRHPGSPFCSQSAPRGGDYAQALRQHRRPNLRHRPCRHPLAASLRLAGPQVAPSRRRNEMS